MKISREKLFTLQIYDTEMKKSKSPQLDIFTTEFEPKKRGFLRYSKMSINEKINFRSRIEHRCNLNTLIYFCLMEGNSLHHDSYFMRPFRPELDYPHWLMPEGWKGRKYKTKFRLKTWKRIFA